MSIIVKLTLKIQLQERDEKLIKSIEKYTQALNYVSTSTYKENSVINAVKMHGKYYKYIRNIYGIPSQMACSVFRDVVGKYRANERKINRAIMFKSSHINFVNNKDFNYKKGILKITDCYGRREHKIILSDYHNRILKCITRVRDSVLIKDEKGSLYFCMVVEIPDVEKKQGTTMGIDIGLSKLATAYTQGKSLVLKGGIVKDKRNKFLKIRRRLQTKGTKSAKRLLRKLSGKENRWMKDVNYCIVKKILGFAIKNNVSHIGIEDLTGIRNARLRKEQRRQINSWAFYDFARILEYKSSMLGMTTIKVNPAYTSQACSLCGYTDKSNRKSQKNFVCRSCGYSLNADINASSNIELLTRLMRSNLLGWDAVNHPYASSVEAKAFFKELRQSLGANLSH